VDGGKDNLIEVGVFCRQHQGRYGQQRVQLLQFPAEGTRRLAATQAERQEDQ